MNQKSGLKKSTIQLLAWFSLGVLFIVDKVLSLVAPPLPEHWYGVLIGIAVFDREQISGIISKIKIK